MVVVGGLEVPVVEVPAAVVVEVLVVVASSSDPQDAAITENTASTTVRRIRNDFIVFSLSLNRRSSNALALIQLFDWTICPCSYCTSLFASPVQYT